LSFLDASQLLNVELYSTALNGQVLDAYGSSMRLVRPESEPGCLYLSRWRAWSAESEAEVAVMSLADVVASQSIRTAGDSMDETIVRYLRKRYSLRIGEQSAEQLKISIGSASPLDHELTCEVSGLDTASGIPRKALVTSEEIREALYEPLEEIVDCVRRTIERCQPELVADLADTGMVLTGGGALLRGIDRYLSQHLGIPVRIADSPRTTVTRGAMICLDHLDRWKTGLDDGQRNY
jgi:rod shape-determining protein MreB